MNYTQIYSSLEYNNFTSISNDFVNKKDICSFAIAIPLPLSALGTAFKPSPSYRGPRTQFWIVSPSNGIAYKVKSWTEYSHLNDLKPGSVLILCNYTWEEYNKSYEIKLDIRRGGTFHILHNGLKYLNGINQAISQQKYVYPILMKHINKCCEFYKSCKYYQAPSSSSSKNNNNNTLEIDDLVYSQDIEYKIKNRNEMVCIETISFQNILLMMNDIEKLNTLIGRKYCVPDAIFCKIFTTPFNVWNLLRIIHHNDNEEDVIYKDCNFTMCTKDGDNKMNVFVASNMIQKLFANIPPDLLLLSLHSRDHNEINDIKDIHQYSEWVELLNTNLQIMMNEKRAFSMILRVRQVGTDEMIPMVLNENKPRFALEELLTPYVEY